MRKELFEEGKKRVAAKEAATLEPSETEDVTHYKAPAEGAQVYEFHS